MPTTTPPPSPKSLLAPDQPRVIEPLASEDLFEINDFTVVTEWEAFVVSFEAIFHEWLTDSDSERRWRDGETRTVFYQGEEYELTYHTDSNKSLQPVKTSDSYDHLSPFTRELLSENQRDFLESTLIERQFGFSTFFLISSASHSIEEEDLLNMIVSAVSTASVNTSFHLPVLVQFGDEERGLYSGVAQTRGSATHFDNAHLYVPLKPHRFLEGLLDIFREKVACQLLTVDQKIQGKSLIPLHSVIKLPINAI